MKRFLGNILWLMVAVAGASAYAVLALHRGEGLNSAYILLAALCSYAIGYRFYSKWLAARVLVLDDRRATPCEVHDDGKDFVRTNRWIVFGHHFAAISGPGPLVGPVLAAQFGYLPGTLWILIGVTLGGAVQDFVVLFASLRRDGKSLGQMVKEELNGAAGFVALTAIVAILVILLACTRLGRGQGPGGKFLGRLHGRLDHPHCDVHGLLLAIRACGKSLGSLGHWGGLSAPGRVGGQGRL